MLCLKCWYHALKIGHTSGLSEFVKIKLSTKPQNVFTKGNIPQHCNYITESLIHPQQSKGVIINNKPHY